MSGVDLERAADFIWRHARLVERRLFQCRLQDASAEPVIAALRAYQNDDGGFGHALEADIRAPDSQPVAVDMALRVLVEARASAPEMLAKACHYLEGVSGPDGGVPAVLATVDGYPRAEHWVVENWPADSLNPTAMIAGLLHAMHFAHPWLDRADTFCWHRLEETTVDSGPTLGAVFSFLNQAPDQKRAVAMAEKVADAIPEADFFSLQPRPPGSDYALTPLDLAPWPAAMGRSLFADELIEAHLENLEAGQQADGGWPLTWDPPTAGAVLEWRGRVTVEALLKLQDYERL